MEIILFLTMMVMITYVFSGYLYRVSIGAIVKSRFNIY